MNKVIIIGRLTRDPDFRYAGENGDVPVARFTVAVNRQSRDDGADFIDCVAFRKTAEFMGNWFHKGMKAVVEGELRNDSYTNKDGQQVRRMNVVAQRVEFGESKAAQERNEEDGYADRPSPSEAGGDGFMNVPDGIEDELPF